MVFSTPLPPYFWRMLDSGSVERGELQETSDCHGKSECVKEIHLSAVERDRSLKLKL